MENLQEAVANAGYETAGYTGYYSSGFGVYGTGELLAWFLSLPAFCLWRCRNLSGKQHQFSFTDFHMQALLANVNVPSFGSV